ncbi:DUF5958 family protein [Streptomyces sp. NPDC091376]|uniref:DUF5958 family protein n=1 Tax=Streptomyces sp. NPDC091376 TaxID=3365994 RepID=UPI0038216921
MTERDIIRNELAQGLRSMSQGIEWFDTHGQQEQSDVLLFLRHHCIRARAVTEDGPESIRRSGLRPTHTPGVLITRGQINQQLGKIAGLTPADERRKAFRLLVAVLAIADERRRERFCSGGCGHWWHRLPVADGRKRVPVQQSSAHARASSEPERAS